MTESIRKLTAVASKIRAHDAASIPRLTRFRRRSRIRINIVRRNMRTATPVPPNLQLRDATNHIGLRCNAPYNTPCIDVEIIPASGSPSMVIRGVSLVHCGSWRGELIRRSNPPKMNRRARYLRKILGMRVSGWCVVIGTSLY